MGKLLGVLSILITVSFYADRAHADWELGYASNTPQVEEIPDSISGDEKADIIEVTDINNEVAPDEDQEKPPVRSETASNSVLKISTQKNTFGVETVEKPGLKLFISPVGGLMSVIGNETVNVSPQFAYGARVGLLISDNMMIEGGYTHAGVNTSGPTKNMSYALNINNDLYAMKQDAFDVGGKFFFLGRESRFRPFIGGGVAYATSTLGLNFGSFSGFSITEQGYKMKQFQGQGQLGAEIAITRGIVATATFKLNGVLSNSGDNGTGLFSTAERATVGDSLSHSATYAGTLGVGIYF